MMKLTLTIESDDQDEHDYMTSLMHHRDILNALDNARRVIRNRIKHESISEDEEKFLLNLQDVLYVEGTEF